MTATTRIDPGDGRTRCEWCLSHPLLVAYHDADWGVPARDDRLLFEHLSLGGAQAGLSWLTILKRREGYRDLFAGFDPEKVARFDETRIERLLLDERIIRNRAKVRSAVNNAARILEVREEHGSFDRFLWSFVGGAPRRNRWKSDGEIPAVTPEAEALSGELKSRGFSFVGPTIVYAFMQAAGLVNDHIVGCFRHGEV